MLRLFKKNVTESVTPYSVRKEVLDFLTTYMVNKRIDSNLVMVKNVLAEKEDDVWAIDIVAGFPAQLIGKNGSIVKDLSKRMSKHLDIKLKLNVRM